MDWFNIKDWLMALVFAVVIGIFLGLWRVIMDYLDRNREPLKYTCFKCDTELDETSIHWAGNMMGNVEKYNYTCPNCGYGADL